jgi:hypothetical protein
MKRWTLSQITKALKDISAMGWIKSNRHHDTGIGKTLEDLLHIKENNIALPDFGVMELKSQRINTPSMLTLFTKSPEGVTNTEIRERFGYPDSEFPKIKILHQTIDNGRKNAKGFDLALNKRAGKLLVKKDNKLIGYYWLDFLKSKAIDKIGNGLIMVLAETKRKNGKEYFYYKKGFILKNIDPTKFLTHSKYDIRLGVYHSGPLIGKPHDHGSAFRLTAKSIPELFRTKRKIF